MSHHIGKEDTVLELIVIPLTLSGAFLVVHGWVPRRGH
jgi:hypothetical protein